MKFLKVWTKSVDETSIANDKILVYKTASGKLEYEKKPTGWWDTTVTTWTVTATWWQTVVTVWTYVIWSNKLQVFVNWLEQLLTTDYTETSTTSITFWTWLVAWDIVKYNLLS